MARPVIVVPGIKGTELWEGKNRRWPALGYRDILRLSPTTGAAILRPGDIVRKIEVVGRWGIDIYGSLMQTLIGLGLDTDIYPYDWRADVLSEVDRFRRVLKDKHETSGQKVTLICHSMGSLLTKAAILSGASDDVDQVITLGAPWRGAPDAYRVLRFGELLPPDNTFLRHVGAAWLNFGSPASPDLMGSVARDCPSVYQLLPNEELVGLLGGYVGRVDGNGMHDYAETVDLIDTHKMFEEKAFTAYAAPLHSLLSQSWPATIQNYAVVGYGHATVAQVMEDPEWYLQRYDGLHYHPLTGKAVARFSDGDKTVPLLSAIPPADHHADTRFVNEVHGYLGRNPSVLQWISNIFSGRASEAVPNLLGSIGDRGEIREKLVMVSCPVEISMDYGNGLPENLDVPELVAAALYQVPPGVSVYEFGETRYLRLVDGQDLMLNIDSFGTGPLNIGLLEVVNGVVEESAQFPEVELTPKTAAKLVVPRSGVGSLLVRDETQPAELEVLPTVLRDEKLADRAAPQVKIFVESITNGKVAGRIGYGHHHLRLEVSDDPAGVLDVVYRINEGRWSKYHGTPVSIKEFGRLEIQAYATDGLRNKPSKLSKKHVRLYSPGDYLQVHTRYESAKVHVYLRTPENQPPDPDAQVEYWLDGHAPRLYDGAAIVLPYNGGVRQLSFRVLNLAYADSMSPRVHTILTDNIREKLWGSGRPISGSDIVQTISVLPDEAAQILLDGKAIGDYLDIRKFPKAHELDVLYPGNSYKVLLKPTYECYSQGDEIVNHGSRVHFRLGLYDEDQTRPITYPELIARLYVKKGKRHELVRTFVPKVKGDWYEFSLSTMEDLPTGEATFRIDFCNFAGIIKQKPFLVTR